MQFADLEGHVVVTQHQGHLGVVVEHPSYLVERPGWNQHLLSRAEHRRTGQVADRQTVGVGGHQA